MISTKKNNDKKQLLQLYGVEPETKPHAHSGFSDVSFFINYVSKLNGPTTDAVDILQTYGALDNLSVREISHIKRSVAQLKNQDTTPAPTPFKQPT